MSIDVVIGLQRGDEGKGRFVDQLASDYDIVARYNGGNNAGHTVIRPTDKGERVLKLHLVPAGIAHKGVVNIIGNGTLIDAARLADEIDGLLDNGVEVNTKNLMISSAAHLILPHHRLDDQIREKGQKRQGTTQSGIAQVASSKALRSGVRAELIAQDPKQLEKLIVEELLAQRSARQDAGIEDIDEAELARSYVQRALCLKKFITDTVTYLNEKLRSQKPAKILAEGAQAYWLDVDHGMYPYTTSTSTTSGGVSPGLGVPPTFVSKIIGVAKAVQSHVGDGPFVTEVTDPKLAARLHGDMTTVDAERGTTTGRTRRLGHLDLAQIRRSIMVNGAHQLALSKLDWVPRFGPEVWLCTAYKIDGKIAKIAPCSAHDLARAKPLYEKLPTWQEDIEGIRHFKDLPVNAQKYIKFIESQTGIPITMIGVGPRHDQVILS